MNFQTRRLPNARIRALQSGISWVNP